MSESVASQSTDQSTESAHRVTRTDGRTYGDEMVTERDRAVESNARAARYGPKPMDPWERLSRKLDMAGGPDACWEWQGHRNRSGYGLTNYVIDGRRRTVIAHRAVYMAVHNVKLTSDQFLLHSCDNPPCCNPAHLRIGDHLQNMADRKTRGAGYPTGSDNHKAAEVSDEVVAAIRAEYRWHTQGRGAPALAAKYGLGRSVVDRIVNRTGRWADAS